MTHTRSAVSSLVIALLLGGAPSAGQSPPPADPPSADPPTSAPDRTPKKVVEPVKVGSEVFKLEVVADEAGREKGLQGRTKLEKGTGMLFIYPNARQRWFWMPNCLIDIDIIFLDGYGRIVSLYEMKAEPPRGADEPESDYHRRLKRYPSHRASQFAIELPAGSLKRLEVKRGQKIQLDLRQLKKMARPPKPTRPPRSR